jgi:hypothetical protein
MANAVGSLAIILSGNAAPLNATLTKATRDIRAFSSGINGMGGKGGSGLLSGILGGTVGGAGGGMFGSLGGAVGGLVAGPVGGLVGSLGGAGIGKAAGLAESAVSGLASLVTEAGRMAITGAADYEMLGASFETMTGSATKGKAMLEEISNLAIKTPYDTKGLADGAKMMMQLGVSTDNILPALSRLGDIAQGDKVKLFDLSRVFGQTKSQGRLMGNDLIQFTTAGVGVEDFAKTMGVLPSEFIRMKEAGEVSFGVVAATINRVTNEGGRFFQGNLKGSKTVMGQWNALQESVTKSLTKIGLSMFKALDVAPTLGRISEMLAPLSGIGDRIAGPLAEIKTLGGDLWAFLHAGWDAASSAARNYGGVLKELTTSSQTFRDAMRVCLETMVIGFGNVGDAVVLLGGLFAKHLLSPLSEGVAASMQATKMMLPTLGFLADPTGKLGGQRFAKGLAAGLEPIAFLARMDRVKAAMIGAAAHTNIAATFAANFRKNLEGGAAAVGKMADRVPEIKAGLEIPPKITDFANKLKAQFAAGDTPLAKFQHEMTMIRQAEGFKLLTPQIANRGMANAFDDLAKQFGKSLETALPKAVMYGSQEAASLISHAMNEGTNDPQQRIARILEIANRQQRMIEKNTADTARALRDLQLSSKGF